MISNLKLAKIIRTALSLCLIFAVFASGIFISTPITQVSAASTYGCGAYPGDYLGEPIGGGVGYTAIYSADDATHAGVHDHSAIVSTAVQLKAALAGSHSGDIVYVADGATCLLTSSLTTLYSIDYFVNVPAGVTLAGGRSNGATGGIIKVDSTLKVLDWRTCILAGVGARITGLNIFGPDESTAASNNYNGVVARDNSEVDNNEIHGFGFTGVYPSSASGVVVHHNYIHHCQRTGLGYGVCTGGTSGLTVPIYEGNIFDYNRHSHMGVAGTASNGRYASFEFRYNYIGAHSTNTVLDVHGQNDGVFGAAGAVWSFHHNTSMCVSDPFIGIRGIPTTMGSIYHNWTATTTAQRWHLDDDDPHVTSINQQMSVMAGYLYDASDDGPFVNMSVYENWYGSLPPPDAPDDPPPLPTHVTTLAAMGVNGSSSLLRGSVSNFDPAAQYPQNTAFVWDTNSWPDPGDTSPDMTDYTSTGDYWDSATAYMDNATIGHRIGGLAPGATYYYRFGVDWAILDEWEYGEEMEFTTDDDGCILYDYINEDDFEIWEVEGWIDDGGTIDPDGFIAVTDSSDITFTIVIDCAGGHSLPDNGIEIDGAPIDWPTDPNYSGDDCGGTYIFHDVHGDRTIYVYPSFPG